MLGRYIRYEWAAINQEVMDYMGYIYERFTKDTCFMYIPLLKGMGGIEMEMDTGRGIDTWIQYIDKHILEDITIRKIAEYFHYSPNHFCDIFQMYYNMDLLEYIRRRRLYLIARELKNETIAIQDVAKKYHFKSIEDFREAFNKEFDSWKIILFILQYNYNILA